jgi:hypothetical protein
MQPIKNNKSNNNKNKLGLLQKEILFHKKFKNKFYPLHHQVKLKLKSKKK